MDWMPLSLMLASGIMSIPLLMNFQKQMGILDKKMREGQAHMREAEANIRKALEEEGQVKEEIDKAKQELAALEKERDQQERKLLAVKMEYSPDEDEEVD